MTAYPAHVLEHYRDPRNRRTLSDATHHHTVSNPLCGDEVSIFLRVRDGMVEDAGWEGVGCAVAVAGASLLTESVRGRAYEEVASMERDHALDLIDAPLNETRRRCATLAWEAATGAASSAASNNQ